MYLKVQIRKWLRPEGSGKARICGVAVREVNQVIVFDRCDDEEEGAGLNVYNTSNWESTHGTQILTADGAKSKLIVSIVMTALSRGKGSKNTSIV